jgi:hypothetical protein
MKANAVKPLKNEPGQICSICNGPLASPQQEAIGWYLGNNAQPINNGRCCDICNGFVIAARMERLSRGKNMREVE